MRTNVVDQANLAVRVAERDQVFAEQPHAQRSAVGLRQIGGLQDRNPIPPHQFAHGRSRADAGEKQVFGFGHGADIPATDGKSRAALAGGGGTS